MRLLHVCGTLVRRLAVGGAGHFAISLDDELLRGSSGVCGTYGSPCLASAEEFEVRMVELWHVH